MKKSKINYSYSWSFTIKFYSLILFILVWLNWLFKFFPQFKTINSILFQYTYLFSMAFIVRVIIYLFICDSKINKKKLFISFLSFLLITLFYNIHDLIYNFNSFNTLLEVFLEYCLSSVTNLLAITFTTSFLINIIFSIFNKSLERDKETYLENNPDDLSKFTSLENILGIYCFKIFIPTGNIKIHKPFNTLSHIKSLKTNKTIATFFCYVEILYLTSFSIFTFFTYKNTSSDFLSKFFWISLLITIMLLIIFINNILLPQKFKIPYFKLIITTTIIFALFPYIIYIISIYFPHVTRTCYLILYISIFYIFFSTLFKKLDYII